MLFLQILKDLFTNPVIMVPVSAWLIAQVIKIIVNFLVNKKLDFSRLFGDGGMPSGHSATVMTLVVITGWCYGFGSIYFAICGILAIIVMNDAAGVRLEAGKHAASIKQIAETINDMFLNKDEKIRTEKLKELIGHTPVQVFCGALLGIIVSVVALIIMATPYAGLA